MFWRPSLCQKSRPNREEERGKLALFLNQKARV
jgi:hypothetical protein